ncbi:wu:fc23c09 [Trichomycterus rosablanca]|uniref:wu:fc23c09 n=1 Tax=Trichomycterus rosablanca TaxID=2290929 RepID=UPI002F352ECC
MRIILLVWIFAEVARTLVLQPSLNGSVLQNSSLVGETWTEWNPDDHHPHHAVKEEVLKWEKEPGTQITVTIKKDEETDTVHSMNMEKEKHKLLQQKEKILIEEQGRHNEDTTGQEEEQGKQVAHKTVFVMRVNKTGDEKQINMFDKRVKNSNLTKETSLEENEDGRPSFSPPTVHPIFNQNSSSPTTHFSQSFSPTTISPSSTTTQNSSAIKFNPEAKDQNMSLSTTEPNHFSFKTITYSPLSNVNSTSDDSYMAQTETNSKPHPKKTDDVALTAMTARAGKTVTSLPRIFKPKPQSKHPNAKKKEKQMIKLKPKKKEKKTNTKPVKKVKQMKKIKQEKHEVTTGSHFPYFEDHYCPPHCNCYGRVVQCSDKELENIPYGIPYNSRYILLMNNRINRIPLGLFSEYLSMEFLVLSNNRLTDSSTEGAFENIQALKRLYMERNLLQSVPADLPVSLEELRLDGNRLKVMSETVWSCCPRLLILSLSNNSLESGSSSIPDGVFSPLSSLRTLSLSHNSLTSIPQHLPLSLQELYLRGNFIQRFQAGVFQGKAQLLVLDLSGNKLTNKGLGKDAFINATRLESLNLEGNVLKQVPSHLPHTLKILNLEGNSISSISKAALLSLPHLEHLGLARNKIFKVVPGVFRVLPLLYQLDLSHNMLHQVPRQLPAWLMYIALNNNKIQTIPRDAFCSVQQTEDPKNRLVKVQLENNLLDLTRLDSLTLSCLRGFQVVHFY